MRKVGNLHEEIDSFLGFYAVAYPEPMLDSYPTIKPVDYNGFCAWTEGRVASEAADYKWSTDGTGSQEPYDWESEDFIDF